VYILTDKVINSISYFIAGAPKNYDKIAYVKLQAKRNPFNLFPFPISHFG